MKLYYRDYRNVDGLQILFVSETRVLPVSTTAPGLRATPVPPGRIVIEKVVVNPKLKEQLFSKVEAPAASTSK